MARPAVVWFFLLSGAMLIPRNESIVMFLTTRLPKLLYPTLLWTIVYLGVSFYEAGELQIAKSWWIWLTEGVFFHLWFMHALIIIYLLLPLLRPLSKDTRIAVYFVIVWVFAAYIFPLLQQYAIGLEANFSYTPGYLLSYSGYPMLGYLILQYIDKIPTLPLLGMFFLTTLLYLYSATHYSLPFNTLYSYKSPFVLGYAILGFSCFAKLRNINPRSYFMPIIRICAGAAFGIYLLHPFILRYMPLLPDKSCGGQFLNAAATFFVCAIIVVTARRYTCGRIFFP